MDHTPPPAPPRLLSPNLGPPAPVQLSIWFWSEPLAGGSWQLCCRAELQSLSAAAASSLQNFSPNKPLTHRGPGSLTFYFLTKFFSKASALPTEARVKIVDFTES